MLKVSPARKAGRPEKGIGQPITVRLHSRLLSELDGWIAGEDDRPSRPEAIRRLINLALADKK